VGTSGGNAQPDRAPSAPERSASASPPAQQADSEGRRTGDWTGATGGRSDTGRGGEDAAGRRAGALFGRGSDARSRRAGAKAKASASGASASDAGGGAEATAAQSGDSGAAASQAGDSGAVATADPVVTGAQATEDSSGALPFTGSGVPLLAVIGLLALAAGLVLRRMTRRVTRAGA
jgi:hypothetical protein